jgi:hypothetical protein
MKIIHWKMSGISVLICVTTLFWTYENLSSNWWIFYDYLCGSSASFLSVLLLYGILHLKKNGISTWALCKDAPQWLLYINRTMITIWLVIIIILPPTIGFAIGFRHNIYSNGELCINAYLNNVSDCYRLYLKTLFDSDYSDDVNNKEHMAGFWLSKVQTICKIEGYHFLDDEISNERLFLDKLIFINNNKGHEAAIQYIASDGDSINFSYIYEFITSIPILYEDIYEPYKNRIIDLLHETSVLDKIDDSTSYSSDDNY